MNKVETIKSALKFLVQIQTEQGSHGFSDAADNEISWNEVIGWIEQQPCEDCVNREDVRRLICKNNDKYGYSDRFHEFTEECLSLPSVTSTRPTGKWIEKEDYNLDIYYECSECGADYCIEGDILIHKYCPNCGCEMTEKMAESEDKE